MKILKKEEYENEWGLYEKTTQANGIIITVLKKPSKKYIDKLQKRKDESKEKRLIKEKKKETESLIQKKMRDNAIEQLKNEGLLDKNGELK